MNKYFNQINMVEIPSLSGKILIAMPHVEEENFNQSIVYVCAHDATGATGLIINRPLNGLTFKDLLQQVEISTLSDCPDKMIFYGGPVDIRRGMVLHSLDYCVEATDIVAGHLGVTSSLDLLKHLSKGNGPEKAMVALGYAGWSAGQLENELTKNMWLISEPTDFLIFNHENSNKWRLALSTLGVQPSCLSLDLGHA